MNFRKLLELTPKSASSFVLRFSGCSVIYCRIWTRMVLGDTCLDNGRERLPPVDALLLVVIGIQR